MIDLLMLRAWDVLSAELKEVKKKELVARKEICFDVFDGSTKKGVHKTNVECLEVRATYVVKTTLDKEALTIIYKSLSDEAKMCIKFSPSLVADELKKLDKDDPLWELITTSPGTPTLELKEDV